MIDENQSTLEAQIYRKTFHAAEFILKDHQVAGLTILPGTAHLEMARAACELAGKRPVHSIIDMLWIRPVVLQPGQENQEVFIRLSPEKNRAAFEIYAIQNSAKVLYSQGKCSYKSQFLSEADLDTPSNISLTNVMARCPVKKSANDIYPALKAAGYNYGPGFQVTQELGWGETEAYTKLKLPAQLKTEDFSSYVLHPSLMDGALRTIMGLRSDQAAAENGGLSIPFALGQLKIFQPLPEVCYAIATELAQNSRDSNSFTKFNLLITDENGVVCAQIHDFAVRQLKNQVPEVAADEMMEDLLYYRPVLE